MKQLFYILLFLSPMQSLGQNAGRFSKLFDENNQWQAFLSGIEVENGSYMLSGANAGPWWSSFFIWNVLLDQHGDTVSTRKIISGDSSTYYPGRRAFAKLNQNYYWAGTQEYFEEEIWDGALMKLDKSGEKIWQKTYGGAKFDSFDAMTMSSQSELVIAGASLSLGDSSWGNIYVVKTDTSGEIIWQKSLGINNFPERCFSIDTTGDRGYVLAGVQGFDSQENNFVIKIDSLGNQKWKKTFGYAIGNNTFPRIRSLENGDFLLTTGLKTSTTGLTKAYVTRLSSTGLKLWEKYYPTGDLHSIFGFSTETSEGNLVNAGGLMEFDSNGNYWVLGTLTKIDAQGNLLWQRKYYTRHDIDNYLFGMTSTSDAGFLMYGFALRKNNNRQDAWAVKVDSLGCLEPGCADGVAAPEPGAAAASLKVYPNPAADRLTVEVEDGILLGLRLSDMSGRVLEDVQFFRQYALREYRLSLAALPPGVYVLSVRTDRGWASEMVVKK